jgi:hypothetical protein
MNSRTTAVPVRDEGKVHVLIPYALYREILEFLDAIGSPLKPDELVADAIRGFLRRSQKLLG